MAASDAKPFPKKNVAYRVTFPILDNDGDLVTGAAGLDSEISLDGGTFADCTNEATEIATSSGIYYLDLTSGEMNADTVAIIVKTSTTDAKTTAMVMYPIEDGDLPVNVTQWLGTACATPTVAGVPEVDITHVGGDAQSATDLKDFADAGYDPTTNKVQGVVLADTVTTLTGHTPQTGDSYARLGAPAGISVSADIAAIEAQTDDIGVAGAGLTALGDTRLANLDAAVSTRLAPAGTLATVTNLTNAPGAGDFTATMKSSLNAATPASVVGAVGSVTGAVGSVTGNVGGNVVGTVGSLAAQAKADVNAEVLDVINTDAATELAAIPTTTGTLRQMVQFLFEYFRNKKTVNATTETVFKEDASTALGTATLSDDAVTFSKGEMN